MYVSIIELRLSPSTNVFLIWGEHDADDCFLTDRENKICGFPSVDHIKQFVAVADKEFSLLHNSELLQHKQLFSGEIMSYSIPLVENILVTNEKIEQLESDDAHVLITLYNFISDFFYQTKNDACLSLREDKNMQTFFDFVYYNFFWKKGQEQLELERELHSFDYDKFLEIYRKLLTAFTDSIKVVCI